MRSWLRRSLWLLAATGLLTLSTAAFADSDSESDSDSDTDRRVGSVSFLDGFQEVPSVSTSARGALFLSIDRRRREIHYALRTGALEGDFWQAHLHLARAGSNGRVVAFLCSTVPLPVAAVPEGTQECPPTEGGIIRGKLDASDILGTPPDVPDQGIAEGEIDEFIRAIRADAVYVNVHSAKFPSGEIRGQLR